MRTVRDDLNHPAILAMIDCSQSGQVIIGWNDGGKMLVKHSVFLPSDETHDGSEQAVFDVLEVLQKGGSIEQYEKNPLNEVSSFINPPDFVSSPDGSKTWRVF